MFLSQIQNGSFISMKTVTFQIGSSEKYLFGFNHSNYVVKREFFKKEQSYDKISHLLQSYFQIDLILTMLFNVYFLYRKS